MSLRYTVFLAALYAVFPGPVAIGGSAPIDYYQPANIRKFADYLYAQGDYRRAAGEYQRYLFSQPDDVNDVVRRIAESYRLGGQPDRAIQFLQTQPDSNLARYELGATYFLMERYDESIRFLKESQERFQGEDYLWKSQILIGMNNLMRKRWDTAIRHFDYRTSVDGSYGLPEDVGHRVAIYKRYAQDGGDLPSKSPLLAGFLSTVLPGSGRLYVGRPNDAFLTVLLVGVLGWGAYDGFSENGISSRKGWTLGTIGGIFYLGNIYGSVIAAQVHNRRTEAAFLATIPFEIP